MKRARAPFQNGLGTKFSSHHAAPGGDSSEDRAVGASRENWSGYTDPGLVLIFMGAADGLAPSHGCEYYLTHQFPRGTTEHGDRFGFALAAGDLDGNGFPDLVIGAPCEDRREASNGGAVFSALSAMKEDGPFHGDWTGTVTGVERTGATLTLSLCNPDGVVSRNESHAAAEPHRDESV